MENIGDIEGGNAVFFFSLGGLMVVDNVHRKNYTLRSL